MGGTVVLKNYVDDNPSHVYTFVKFHYYTEFVKYYHFGKCYIVLSFFSTNGHKSPQVNFFLSVATIALLTNEVSSVLLTAKRGIIFGMSGSQEKC